MGGLALRLEPAIKARLPEGGRLLWIDPPADGALAALGATGYSTRLDISRRLRCGFGPWLTAESPFDMALVTMPKGRQACRMLLTMAAEALKPGGELILVGETRLGVKSAATDLGTIAGSAVEKLGHGNHGSAYIAKLERTIEPAGLDAWWQSWQGPGGLEIVGLPGVFSAEGLDDGTAFLLKVMDQPFLAKYPKILDYGCGSGVIAAWAAKGGASVEAMDVSALAVAATTETARRNGLEIAVVAAHSIDETRRKHDAILSNPPFHQGRYVDLDVAREFLTKARTHLRAHGIIRLVANRFLPYAEPLAEVFGAVETVADDGRFRVLQAGGRSHATRRKEQEV